MNFNFPRTLKLSSLLAVITLFFACDEEESIDYNYFKIYNKEYKIEEAIIIKDMESDTSGYFSVAFVDDHIERTTGDSGQIEINFPDGYSFVQFYKSKFSNEVKNGKYLLVSQYQNPYGYGGYNPDQKSPLQFPFGQIGLNINSSDTTYDQWFSFSSGEIELKISKENYQIKFNCIGINRDIVEGQFSGVPLEITRRIQEDEE